MSMVDPELLDLLVCPETKEPVRLMEPEELAEVNRSIAEHKLKTRGGDEVREPLEGALVRQDGAVLYPVRDDIPVMLIDQAIPLDRPS
ncbi:MAG: hypothetical protein EA352_04920 [Gemmatimonadales bacterium]|nr:MAG: hypothetical protein EA352_04920 [Gemmatimonadales bacterium]